MKLNSLLKTSILTILLSLIIGTSPSQSMGADNVDLVGFTASYSPGQILIEWETATELDTAGFIVTRSTAPDPTYDDISQFILARGSGAGGAEYSFIDDDIEEGTTYYYILQAWDINNNFESFGPISVDAGEINYNIWESNGPVLGNINALVLDPVTPATLYAGTSRIWHI